MYKEISFFQKEEYKESSLLLPPDILQICNQPARRRTQLLATITLHPCDHRGAQKGQKNNPFVQNPQLVSGDDCMYMLSRINNTLEANKNNI